MFVAGLDLRILNKYASPCDHNSLIFSIKRILTSFEKLQRTNSDVNIL